MIEVIAGAKDEVGQFVVDRLPMAPRTPRVYEALGAWDGKRLIGGFLYLNYVHLRDGLHTLDMHMAGEPGWLTRKTLRAFYAYPFNQLNCSRVVGNIPRFNEHSRDVAERMGFKLAGIMPSGISDDVDCFVYVMTRGDCPWLR